MLIEYYKSSDLAYANRKRYKTFNYVADASETQRAIKLGDGATTSITTSASNICNYVVITQTADDNTIIQKTRWYVTYYTYLNGGQVELYLQRDVIGELGLDGMFGKIERGYTETFLRNRKELSLNQRLIKRTPLIPSNDKYGNYTVSTHTNEKWGILYFSSPTEIDSSTGRAKVGTAPSINIPGFEPDINHELTFIPDGSIYNVKVYDNNPILTFNVKVNNEYWSIDIQFHYDENTNTWDFYLADSSRIYEISSQTKYINISYSGSHSSFDVCYKVYRAVASYFAIQGNVPDFLPYVDNSRPVGDYNGANIEAIIGGNTETIQYTVLSSNVYNTSLSYATLSSKIIYAINNYSDPWLLYATDNNSEPYTFYYDTNLVQETYTYRILSPSESGVLALNKLQDFIDEPYICYAFPLYDVTITASGGYSKTIDKTQAFKIFNTVIQACSGENSYLVDAQIYPYCPELTSIASSIGEYPFFNINSTSFTTNIDVQLKPYLDIKKEYIKRDYFIVSPEQSSNISFNFYDYTNNKTTVVGDEVYNYQELEISIKTSLKPMNIIASAVIIPQSDALKGITYSSDLRGCQPTSNGFEVSLATDKFQEYIRNNSNYQAIFGLQQEELKRTHQVELVNEITSTIVNTTTATAMGAIGGMAIGSAGIASAFGSKALAAGIGASVAGTAVGAAMSAQTIENEKLRKYEESLQKQNFDLQIGTIKNIPNTVSRISSFNEIIMQNFYFVIETYECSTQESEIVDTFIEKYAYGLGVFGKYEDFKRNGWFLRGTLITSNLLPALHNVAENELNGGIYYNE